MKLVIGNKDYSSWSMRAWLLLKHFNIAFEEEQVSLFSGHLRERLLKYSPSARVPVLIDNGLDIWDSLAISEYINEQYLHGKGWPENMDARTRARTISAEMHAGFVALRSELPMSIARKIEKSPSRDAQQDINRVLDIWQDCRQRIVDQPSKSSGPWLFGEFSIADCMYAPVVTRFVTYGIKVEGLAKDYMDTVLAHQEMQAWIEQAKMETEIDPEIS